MSRQTDTNTAVAQRIRTVRRLVGLTQADVACQLTPPRSHVAVSDIERGKTAITVDMLFQLTTILDCTLGQLLAIELPASPSLADRVTALEAIVYREDDPSV